MRARCGALVSASLALLIALGCGGEESAAPEVPAASPEVVPGSGTGERERSPVIEALSIEPQAAAAGDELTLQVRAHAASGDRVTTEIHWFVNGKLYREGSRTRLDTSRLQRGDQVYAMAQVSDGRSTAVQQSPTLVLGNAHPRVVQLRIAPAVLRGSAPTSADARVEDAENDPVTLSYQWLVDGQPLADATGPTLPAGRLKRGQHVRVRAAASDKSGEGEWAESEEVAVGNTGPVIQSEPVLALAGERRYEYQIEASDPDGDRPLRYQLVEGPAGMEVDMISGMVSWRLPKDSAAGSVPVEVEVKDSYGGSARQRYELDLQWEELPASRDSAK